MKFRYEARERVVTLQGSERKACRDCFKGDLALYYCEVDKRLRCKVHILKHDTIPIYMGEEGRRTHQDWIVSKFEVE